MTYREVGDVMCFVWTDGRTKFDPVWFVVTRAGIGGTNGAQVTCFKDGPEWRVGGTAGFGGDGETWPSDDEIPADVWEALARFHARMLTDA